MKSKRILQVEARIITELFLGGHITREEFNIKIENLKEGSRLGKPPKPPIDLALRKFAEEESLKLVCEAIKRYLDANMIVPVEWTHELHEINQRDTRRSV